MISRKYGVRMVRQWPGSAEAVLLRNRCASAHALTESAGSGAKPWPKADAHSSATVTVISASLGLS
jgi:hypothetical protein